MSETAIVARAEALSKTYRSGSTDLVIFSALDFSLHQGERVAVTGESGAGKSTLLHLLGGLDRPTSGRVFHGDADIFALDDVQLAVFRNRTIGFLWQQSSLLVEFTAEENVMMPLVVRGEDFPSAARSARARLDEVGLANRAHHRAGELSGGEQQRVALARALVGNPKVLLADEPTGSLDYKTGESVARLLERLHSAHGLTSVIVTHNLALAEGCDRVLQLEKGRLVGPAPN